MLGYNFARMDHPSNTKRKHIANKSPFLVVVLGNFNARMQGRYQNDITTFEECKIDIATSLFSFSQIIKKTTHIERCDFLHRLKFYIST